MNDRDFRLVMRAKRQIQREAAMRSFLLIGLVFCAVLRMMEVELPVLYRVLFAMVLIALVLSSDLFASIGLVSKKDLVAVIEKHIHSDPEALSQYVNARSKS